MSLANRWCYGEEFTSAGIGAPLLYQFTGLAGYYFADQNTIHVDYIARDGSIIEVDRDNDGWHTNNLSTSAGETVKALDGPSAYLLGGIRHVVIDLSWGPLASNPQFVQDVDGDGLADVVAFAADGVRTALGKGDGTFDWPQLGTPDFGYNAGGWRVEKHVRFIGDVTGDARQDVVGFGDAGVYVALAIGGGAFGATQPAVPTSATIRAGVLTGARPRGPSQEGPQGHHRLRRRGRLRGAQQRERHVLLHAYPGPSRFRLQLWLVHRPASALRGRPHRTGHRGHHRLL